MVSATQGPHSPTQLWRAIKFWLIFQLVCWLFLLNVISNSYTMGCPPVRGDNPRALASGLSYVQVDKHGITSLYHLHQCRPCTSRDILRLSW